MKNEIDIIKEIIEEINKENKQDNKKANNNIENNNITINNINETNDKNDKNDDNDKDKINYSRKVYYKNKDKIIFKEIKNRINSIFNTDYVEEQKELEKCSIFLNQLNSNAKYIDIGILIYNEEKDGKLIFSLIVYQITIKKKKEKIYNKNEVCLILSYIKEYLEKKFKNIIIKEASYYYIIDNETKDNNLLKLCNENSIGCFMFNIKNKTFKKCNSYDFKIEHFSLFNSCFILKNDNEDISKEINLVEPVIFPELNKDKLEKIYNTLLSKDIEIPNDYYIYTDLKCDIKIIKNLTNYSFLILCNKNNDKDIVFICLNENIFFNYKTLNIINVNEVKINEYCIKLIVCLTPITLKKIDE